MRHDSTRLAEIRDRRLTLDGERSWIEERGSLVIVEVSHGGLDEGIEHHEVGHGLDVEKRKKVVCVTLLQRKSAATTKS